MVGLGYIREKERELHVPPGWLLLLALFLPRRLMPPFMSDRGGRREGFGGSKFEWWIWRCFILLENNFSQVLGI